MKLVRCNKCKKEYYICDELNELIETYVNPWLK